MSHGGAGKAGRAQSQLKKRGAWGQGHGAMGPWGPGAMSHGREGREGRRGQACTGALLWDHEAERAGMAGRAGSAGRAGRAEGAGMHWGPLKSAYQERGMGPGSMEPCRGP